MYTYLYPRPSVTATVFAFYNNMLLTGIRSKTSDAFPSKQSIPGGFLNAKINAGDNYAISKEIEIFEGETVEQTAIREFAEECNVQLSGDQLILFHEHSNPDTDPRAHVVNLCYIAHLTLEQVERLAPGDDLESLDFVFLHEVAFGSGENWAFNHFDLAKIAVHVMSLGGDYFRNEGIWKL